MPKQFKFILFALLMVGAMLGAQLEPIDVDFFTLHKSQSTSGLVHKNTL